MNKLRFLLPSILGVLIFLTPIPWDGSLTIVISIVNRWIKNLMGAYGLHFVVGILVTTSVLTVLGTMFSTGWIQRNAILKDLFDVSRIWLALSFATNARKTLVPSNHLSTLNLNPFFVNDTPFMIRLCAHFLVSINHRQPVRHVMWPPTPIYERVPMVWFLLGLLFNATGLYLGFEYSLSFWYLIIGWFCCAYGVAIFVFRLGMRPKAAADTRLSPAFVSGDPILAAPAMSNNDHVPGMEQSGAE